MHDLSAPSVSAAPFLHLHDAVVKRAGRAILNIEDFSLAEGESMALLGPNGSGKSTFVKLMTREVVPLHREEPPVLLRGNPRPTLEEVKGCLGVVSSTMQDQITVHLPAVDVVVGGLFGALGVPRHVQTGEGDYKQALQAMESLGIGDLANRDIMTLSTGQARRVLIARALVHDPHALVFDEPCTGLDPQGMFYVRQTMRQIAQAGRAVILVTHYPEDIIPEIDRLVFVKEGRIFASGAKEDLLADGPLSELFDVPLHVLRQGNSFALAGVC